MSDCQLLAWIPAWKTYAGDVFSTVGVFGTKAGAAAPRPAASLLPFALGRDVLASDGLGCQLGPKRSVTASSPGRGGRRCRNSFSRLDGQSRRSTSEWEAHSWVIVDALHHQHSAQSLRFSDDSLQNLETGRPCIWSVPSHVQLPNIPINHDIPTQPLRRFCLSG